MGKQLLNTFDGKINGKSKKAADNFVHISEPARRIVDRVAANISEAVFYRDCRAIYRPGACTRGSRCWVEYGPSCYAMRLKNGDGGCVECESAPLDVRRVPRHQR